MMAFVLMGFGAGLRGEEIPLVSLAGMNSFWVETHGEEDPYTMLTLCGHFKGEVDERWHCVPISDQTRSGIPFRLWFQRALHRRVNLQGRTDGWFFQRSGGKRARFGDYDDTFRELIQKARERYPRVLPAAVELHDFSLWRSPRRGATLEPTNQDVSEKIIELVNRWRKREAARGTEPGLPMRQVYTQARSAVPIMKAFSKAL